MDKQKLQECEIVQDLLPLYYDDVCTSSSKKYVQNHLEKCETCKKLYEELKNDSVGRLMERETHDVLERHARKERTAAYKAGLIISADSDSYNITGFHGCRRRSGCFLSSSGIHAAGCCFDCHSPYDETAKTGKEYCGRRDRIIADYFLRRQDERRRPVYFPGCTDYFRSFHPSVPLCDQRTLLTARTV